MTPLKTTDEMPPTLTLLSGTPSRGTILFFPDVGGNVLYAQNLVSSLRNDFACYAVRLSPDMASDLDDLSIDSMCRSFAEDIVAAGIQRPIYLVGFSFAALFAAETACQMSILDSPPERLWILDMPARRRVGPRTAIRYLRDKLSRMLFRNDDSEFLHRLGFIRLNLSSFPESFREILRTLYPILTVFTPRPWIGQATLVLAENRIRRWNGQGDLGWSKIIQGDLTTCVAPGDHLSMLHDAENSAVLAELIRTQLDLDCRNRS